MDEKKGFDLASVLGSVSGSNTEEQIIRIPLDRIDPDPDNFYSLEGLNSLAGNIELIGLQQPLRVRPSGERYIIVSGHRRRAAIALITDGGSQQFAAGVPCIVEYGEASDAMRKLRLIYANSATRVLSPSEISKQAEEVQALLYELKEQGVEFPGRMRDHVAEACKVSRTKLARLHAIRANLDSNLLLYFDRGDLNEDAAYKLSQFPADLQFAISQELINGRRKRCPSGVVVEAVLRNLKEMQEGELKCRAHAGGPDCHHRQDRIIRSVFAQYDWNICTPGKCCMDCRHAAEGCSGACKEAKDRVKLEKAVEADKRAEREKAQEAERDRIKAAVVKRCRALVPLIEAAGLKDTDRIYDGYEAAKAGDVKKWAHDGAAGRTFYATTCVEPWRVEELKNLARNLKLDAAALLDGRIEAAQPEQAPDEEGDVFVNHSWRSLTDPPINAPGWYAVKVRICGSDVTARKVLWWGDGWFLNDRPDAHPLDDINEVVAWFPLPDDEDDEDSP